VVALYAWDEDHGQLDAGAALRHGKFYKASVFAISASSLLVGVGFLAFGRRMLRSLDRLLASDAASTARRAHFQRVMSHLAVVIASVTACFFVRTVCFSWHAVTGYEVPAALDSFLYPWLWYQVPELVPSVAFLWMMSPPMPPKLRSRLECCACGRAKRRSSYHWSDNAGPVTDTGQASFSGGYDEK